MPLRNETQAQATQNDDNQFIGSKSIFTPEFQQRLFAAFEVTSIYEIERLLMMRVILHEMKGHANG